MRKLFTVVGRVLSDPDVNGPVAIRLRFSHEGRRHGIAGKPARIHLLEMILAHFRRHLA